ncbi:hypothetical protein FOL47_000882, partial [Perkinsus chesapeaki]
IPILNLMDSAKRLLKVMLDALARTILGCTVNQLRYGHTLPNPVYAGKSALKTPIVRASLTVMLHR